MKKGIAAFSLVSVVFASLFIISLSLQPLPAAAAHITTVTITPDTASCGDLSKTYTVSVENGGPDNIREVRIFDDVDGDGDRDAGIVDFQCGPAPFNWTLTDRLALFHYCQYETPVRNAAMINAGETLNFTFTATLDEGNLECGNEFKVATIDDKIPLGEVVFKFPQVRVDCTDPLLFKEVGDPKILIDQDCDPQIATCDYWVRQDTNIHFSASDEQVCDLGIDRCEYRITVDGVVGDWTSWNPAGHDLMYGEDSNHQLEIRCFDRAGNMKSLTENEKVDSTPPITTKRFIGPQKIQDGVEWIDGVTTVELTPGDPDPTGQSCNIGVDKTWYLNVLASGAIEQNGIELDVAIEHPQAEMPCWDRDVCNALATAFAPLSPYSNSEKLACIETAQTNCDEEFSRGTADWYSCVEALSYQFCTVDPNWKLYRGTPIEKDEESCHVLFYQSVDHLGNVEPLQTNCFFVDKSPPVLEKDNGQAIKGNDPALETPRTPNGEFHWITPSMPVTFTCTDAQPHPSGDEQVCFKVSYDKDPFDLTSDYCQNYGGQMGQDGFCCTMVDADNEFVFNFNENEDSVHDLEYYCKDAVNKRTETHLQWYKVDDSAPTIHKEMFGSWLGQCPPRPGSDDVCYVADNGQSGVNVLVSDRGEICHIDQLACTYSVYWHVDADTCSINGGEFDGENCLIDVGRFDDDAQIVFSHDSTHDLVITCQDGLGNTVTDTETFLVDSTPPVTTKTYGNPMFTCTNWCEARCEYEGPGDCVYACQQEFCGGQDVGGHWMPVWINSSTPVTLDVIDNKVGVDVTYWRNMVIEDREGWGACEQARLCDPEFYDQFVDLETPWNTYSTPFLKPGESCHVIEYYSVDKLGNQEKIKHQCVFVDNTPPVPIKTIGDPKVVVLVGNTTGQVCTNVTIDTSPAALNLTNTGKFVHTTNFSVNCPTGVGVGVAFDGTNLWYSCIAGGNDLYKADAKNGMVHVAYDIVPGGGGLGALSYDAGRNAIWAGYADSSKKIRLLHLDVNRNLTSITEEFVAAVGGIALDDGLAYDAQDDTLYISPDIDATVYQFNVTGGLIRSFPKAPGSSCGASGLAIGGQLLYEGFNGCNQVRVVNKNNTGVVVFNFSTQQSGDPAFRDEDLECDTKTFADMGKHVMWSVEAYDGGGNGARRALAFEIPFNSCGIGGRTVEVCTNVTVANETVTYITQDTPINLTCVDPQPHPVDHATVHWRFNINDGAWTEWQWSEESETIIHFTEDSRHTLEYMCKDALGNEGPIFSEVDIVDTQPPVITKTVVGPQVGQCPPRPETDDVCIIDGVTRIHVEAIDPQPHPVGRVTCDWWYTVDDGDPITGGEGVVAPFDINFPEESNHLLHIVCHDGLGNAVRDVEAFQVDKTPPVTHKQYVGPLFENETGEWISSMTNITLWVEDAGPHKSGVNATYWRVSLVDDTYCNGRDEAQDELGCSDAPGAGEWQTYSTPFHIAEQSCHLIEFYSVDNVEKTERYNRQCAFVDNTAPLPNKTVGEPREMLSSAYNWTYYPEINGRCWAGQNGIECWQVTTMTPITLDCRDPQPHPVDHGNVCFKVGFDGDDVTQNYCEDLGGDMQANGYCCMLEEESPVTISFGEESEHNLAFYCQDALGNVGPVDDEKFKVEGSAFNITLNKKWNLISVPFVLQNNAMDDVFGTTNDKIVGVWTYDAFTGLWYLYTPDGVDNDNLDTMLPGWGYWVLTRNATNITIGGSLFSPGKTPPNKDLAGGWNLIGYYGNQDRFGNPVMSYDGPISVPHPVGDDKKSKCELGTLVDTTVGNPKWSSLYTYWEPYNNDDDLSTPLWIPLDFHDRMDVGAGYWIEIEGSESYAPATTCADP